MQKLRIIVVLLIIAISVMAILKVSDSFNFGTIEEPWEYRKFLNPNSNFPIEHVHTFTKENSFPFSVYEINNNLGLLVFKKRVHDSIKGIPRTIYSSDCSSDNSTPSIGSIFTNELNYSFTPDSVIHKIFICIEDFDSKYVQFESKDSLYLSFPMKGKVGIRFQEEGSIEVFGTKNTSLDTEKNELLVIRKREFIYFFYLKPYTQSVKEDITISEILNF